ncbi:bifunctional folylpolyglutamate synthase/dihydrofolate synthase [Furfurilactobacillus cerevisiae]|uniref:bifunctional folylpolyglutamate synthase/dihydrofolate synthase n=1 Tax=Furfurilactobacillus rossiae TaxID=231049 RepID=UPI003B98607D
MVKTYEEAVAYIHGRSKFKKSPTLDRMRLFLERLNHPETDIQMVHIVGTNGKGSTLTFLRNLLQADGLTVGSFTSPYLVRFNERISVDGEPISDADILRLVQIIQPVEATLDEELPEGGPTEFETLTAMMLLYFAEGHADIVLVEAGLGGRFDSTNVITPLLSVITTIGLDHMKMLGDTVSKIAWQKAGIAKPDVPMITGNITDDGALSVIREVTTRTDTPWFAMNRDYQIHYQSAQGWQERFSFDGFDQHLKDLTISMLGRYQSDNAATALATYLKLHQLQQLPVSVKSIRDGLNTAFWAGRFEKLNDQPLVVIDGAHNEPAVDELAKLIKTHFGQQSVTIIFAVLADKAYEKMLPTLAALPNVHLVLTHFAGPNAKRNAADLDALEASLKQPVPKFDNWQVAIAQTAGGLSADDVLIITGSLYFISDVRHLFTDNDEVANN